MRTNLHPDEALALVLEAARNSILPVERVPLESALSRILAEHLLSPIDHPPFDKSAMDGFAFSGAGEPGIFRVIDSVPAGKAPSVTPGHGEAIRIMTGAPVPEGCAGVQRVEWTEEAGRDADGFSLVRFLKPESITNIIRQGENLAAGEVLLTPRQLAPQDLGILAAAGFADVPVRVAPRVAVVSTGDEIEPAGARLPAAAIYDSNGPQLAAQARAAGARAEHLGIVRDEKASLEAVLGKALDEYDLVLVSGGVSLGDFDLVPKTLAALGVETVFHSLAMRPGKPTFFGTRGRKAVFGLPGNPVSTFVNFEVMVKPYLYGLAGVEHRPRHVKGALAAPLARKGGDRVEFLPAAVSFGADSASADRADQGAALPGSSCMEIEPLSYRGSSMITILAKADALLRMEIGQTRLEKGEIVHARWIRP